jgi:GAF domain-containing protein
LQVQGAEIGQLTLAEPQEMTGEVTSIVSEVAGRLSTHIENLRLTEETERALAGTEALYQGSERVVRANTLDDVLQALIESTALQQLDGVSILLHDEVVTTNERPESVTAAASWGESKDKVPVGVTMTVQEFPFARFIDPEKPTIMRDFTTDHRIDDTTRAFLETTGMRSPAIFPLVVGRQWIGLLSGQAATPLQMNDEEMRQIDSLADQAAAVIQSKRLFEQVQEALLETQALYDFSGQLNAAADLDDIVQAVALPEISPEARNVTLSLLDVGETGQPEWATLVASWPGEEIASTVPLGTRFHLPELPTAKLWISNPHVPVLIEDIESDERLDQLTRQIYQQAETRASVIMPLSIGGQWLGLLILNWAEPKQFTERDERLYKSVATQTAVALSNQQLLEQSQERARRERMLRQITARVRGSADVESIMQTAVQEVGQALGRKAFIYLGNGNQEQPETSVEEKET